MRKLLSLLFVLGIAATARSATAPDNLVLVDGGSVKDTKSNFYGKNFTTDQYIGRPISVPSFYLGKYEVTQKEWTDVMGSNPSKFKGDNLPVETVSWYDCIEYCNRRSLKEGLQPYYNIDRVHKDPNNKNEIDDLKWTVTINAAANGYRLPTELEWEYAASGGQQSKSYTYCGGEDVNQVAWYWANSGDKVLGGYWSWPVVEANHSRTHPVGSKPPNELGLYDMAGNVREWCWNWYGDKADSGTGPDSGAAGRVWKGGGWMGGDFCCASAFRASYEASGKASDQGLRVCRNR